MTRQRFLAFFGCNGTADVPATNCSLLQAIYAEPTPAELLGLIASYLAKGSDRRTFRDDMVDISLMQALEWQLHGRLINWVEVPAFLFMAREDLLRGMGLFERFRMQRRFATIYKRDIGFVNLGAFGERLRFLHVKWIQEYVAQPLIRYSPEETRVLLVLHTIEQELTRFAVAPGVVQQALARAVERYVRAKLRLEYMLAAALYGQGTNVTSLSASIAARVDEVLHGATDQLITITINQVVGSNSS